MLPASLKDLNTDDTDKTDLHRIFFIRLADCADSADGCDIRHTDDTDWTDLHRLFIICRDAPWRVSNFKEAKFWTSPKPKIKRSFVPSGLIHNSWIQFIRLICVICVLFVVNLQLTTYNSKCTIARISQKKSNLANWYLKVKRDDAKNILENTIYRPMYLRVRPQIQVAAALCVQLFEGVQRAWLSRRALQLRAYTGHVWDSKSITNHLPTQWRNVINMITLYHGTNIAFDHIELSKCLPHKDFGRGFYLTTIRQQAMSRARNKCEIEGGSPCVLTFQLNENDLQNLKVKHFETTNVDWAQFVLANRNRYNKQMHDYDVVIGPVADDGVISSIRLYEAKIIDLETLQKNLTYARPNIQYAFCTERALTLLRKIWKRLNLNSLSARLLMT